MDDKTKFFLFLLVAIVFYSIYSYNTLTPSFRTPDENSNYIFSLQYAKNGTLFYNENLNEVANNTIAPLSASFNANGNIVPRKFVGFPMYYGTFIRFIGKNILPYLTPIFAGIGIFVIYLFSKTLFGKKNGLISGILLVIFPPYWFWANFPLFETVFVSILFVIGLSYFFKSLKQPFLSYYILATLFFTTALNIRYDLILLFIPIFIIILLNLKSINIKYLVICIPIIVFVISPVLISNHQLYGGYFNIGVKLDETSFESGISLFGRSINADVREISALMPNIKYYIAMSPVFFISMFISVIFLLKSGKKIHYYYSFFILSSYIIYLVLFETYSTPDWIYHYGWPPLQQSFTRYIMPLILASFPLFVHLIQKFNMHKIGRVISILIIFIYIIGSVSYTPQELSQGVWEIRIEQKYILDKVTDNTEPNAIIFVERLERTIFPTRKVIPIDRIDGMSSKEKFETMAKIASELLERNIPVYIYKYHHEILDDFIDVEETLLSSDMKLEMVVNNRNSGSLYMVKWNETDKK